LRVRRWRLLLGTCTVALAVVVVSALSSAEVLDLVAVGEVQLVARENSMQATAPVVMTLHAGQRLRVYGCEPRKSDIGIELRVDGKAVVARGSHFIIERHSASLEDRVTQPGVTSTCHGLLSR
jgi:hypothetical protein